MGPTYVCVYAVMDERLQDEGTLARGGEAETSCSRGKTDLLLRFFNSSFFNEWIAVTYLWRTQSEGVEDYLCNRLYTLPEDGLEKYLNQLCTIVARKGSERTQQVLVDLCGCSMRIACKVHWLLLAIGEDRPNSTFIQELQHKCDQAAINGKWHLPFRECTEAKMRKEIKEAQDKVKGKKKKEEKRRILEIRRSVGQSLCISCGASSGDEEEGETLVTTPTKPKSPRTQPPSLSTFGSMSPQSTFQKLRMKIGRHSQHSVRLEEPLSPKMRRNMFNASLDLVKALCEASAGLARIYTMGERKQVLVRTLKAIDQELDASPPVIFPMSKGGHHDRVVHIPAEEATLLNSRDKAPFLLFLEVIKEDCVPQKAGKADSVLEDHREATSNGLQVRNGGAVCSDGNGEHLPDLSTSFYKAVNDVKQVSRLVHVTLIVELPRRGSMLNMALLNGTSATEQANVRVSMKPIEPSLNISKPADYVKQRVPSFDALRFMAESQNLQLPPSAEFDSPAAFEEAEQCSVESGDSEDLAKKAREVYGELFEEKKARIQKQSPHGSETNWDLYQVIVKSGDDCRQELLAVQLVQQFDSIFKETGLPLWVRPYEVLVTSSHTALIETVPDAISIHSLKSKWQGELKSYFVAKYGVGTQSLQDAQRRFVESMAGYSLVSYLLQVKDRHNGNILLDKDGHVIHVDFGFMLSNSPGGVNFETAPFKLTREFLEVMDSDAEGKGSDLFDYYKVLLIQGFLACRKHSDRIVLLVEMMQHSGSPCFKSGTRAIQNLSRRLHMSLTEEQCIELVLGLISDSMDAWRTRQYDYYQRVLNGIQ